jgi:heptosyltransferase-1
VSRPGRAKARHRAPDLRANPPSRVLLVRLSARGDLVFATPLIAAFKRTYPEVHLTWVAEPHTKDLVTSHPDVDEVIVWERRRWKELLKRGRLISLWREARALRSRLRGAEYDVAIDLQGLLKSALIAYLSGAGIRIGVGSRELSHLLMHYAFYDPDVSRVSSQYRRLAETLGLNTDTFELDVAVSRNDEAYADDRISEFGLGGGFAVLVPFTTWPQKHWIESRWSELSDRVFSDLGLRSVLLGGPGDQQPARRIVDGAQQPVVDLVGETTLGQATAIVARASLVIGVDTGLNHLGLSFDRPTVSLFGPAVPYAIPPSQRGIILHHPLPCSPCWRKPTCDGAFTCMRLIDVEEVMAAAAGQVRLRTSTNDEPGASNARTQVQQGEQQL